MRKHSPVTPMSPLAIDLRSVILLTGFLGLLLSLVLYFLQRVYGQHARAIRFWAAGPVLIFLASILFSIRGSMSFVVSSTLGCFFLLAGIGCQLAGSAGFFQVRLRYKAWGALIGAALLWNYGFNVWGAQNTLRILPLILISALLFGTHARLVWRHRSDFFSTRMVAGCFALEVVLLLLRVGLLGYWDSVDLLAPTPIQTIMIIGYTITMTVSSVGLILMAMESLHRDLEYLALHDMLTGVLLRRPFIERAARELERVRRHGGDASLMMLDVDHFKRINDGYGHLVGDQVLKDLAQRIGAELRSLDSLGRFGGEEFVILLPDTSAADALVVAERVRATLAEPSDGLPAYTVSIGVSAARVDDGLVDDWIARADQALYKAKTGGRNRVELADHPAELALGLAPTYFI